MKHAGWIAAALLLSGCRPEVTFFLEFRPDRVLLEGPQASLRLDVFRPNGFLGPVTLSAELQRTDGTPLMGDGAARLANPDQAMVKLTNLVDVSLSTVIAPREIVVVARGESEGEKREAKATLDLSLLGAWAITTTAPEAPVDRGAPVTLDVEATGFNVEGTLELELRVASGQVFIGPIARRIPVSTKGRNNGPIARFSTTFTVPAGEQGPVTVTIRGRLIPAAPLIVVGANQAREFELRVNE